VLRRCELRRIASTQRKPRCSGRSAISDCHALCSPPSKESCGLKKSVPKAISWGWMLIPRYYSVFKGVDADPGSLCRFKMTDACPQSIIYAGRGISHLHWGEFDIAEDLISALSMFGTTVFPRVNNLNSRNETIST
jgi:hypothetical protein